MVKDKIKFVLKVIEKTFNLVKQAINKIISYVHFIDPSENTKQRVFASIGLLVVALYSIFYSKSVFIFFAIAIAILMTIEWLDMIKNMQDQKKWKLIGFFYILIPIYCVIKIRLISSDILFWMFAIIWITDTFAFFAGKSLGGIKLAPKISPNKTWSGLIGGVVASALIGIITSSMFLGSISFFLCMSVFLSILEQVSDLLESKFKRTFGVKDSGNIIPGHGGILDRLDGMMLLAPVVLVIASIFPSQFNG